MKTTYRKLAAMVLIAISIGSAAFKSISSDMSGSYTRNTAQSATGPGISMNSIPTDVVIKQTEKQFEITRTQKYGSGKIETYTEVLKLDGSKTETKIDEHTKKISTVQYSPDKGSFTEASTYTDESGNTTQQKTETWSLLNGGNTLQVKVNGQQDDDEYSWTGVFDKKQ